MVTFGINNLFNTKPPISDDVFGYNVTMFNDRGRFLYLKLSLATR